MGVETFVIRMWLPDRPGALGQVASRIGAVRGDVVGIDILERDGGQAVDELVVELPDGALVDLLVNEVRQVDGVAVEEVRPLADALHDPRLDALEAAAQLVGADDIEDLLSAVVTHARRVVGATWVAVVDIDERGDGVLAADENAPSPAWLEAFLAGSRAAEGVNQGSRGRSARTSSGRPWPTPDWPWCWGARACRTGRGSGARWPPSPGSWTRGCASCTAPDRRRGTPAADRRGTGCGVSPPPSRPSPIPRRPALRRAGRTGPDPSRVTGLNPSRVTALNPSRVTAPLRAAAGVGGVGRGAVGLGLAADVEVPRRGHVVGRAPDALGQAGQVGRAEGGGLLDHRPGHRDLELVRLELEQQVHDRRPAVHPQLGDGVAGSGGHGIDDVAGLERHGLDHGPGQLGRAGAPGDAHDRAPGVRGPTTGCPRPTKAGTR
jgi:hypothetical protein